MKDEFDNLMIMMGNMSFTTIAQLPPPIKQYFNRFLLMDILERKKWSLENVIHPLAKKKIRPQDVGKQREFNLLLLKYQEIYERKKIEKADYEAACKEKEKKVPHFPTSGGTMRFRRMATKGSNDGNDDGDFVI